MKSIIIAAGSGRRIPEFSKLIPKSLINAAYNEDTDVVLPDPAELINPVDISIDLKPGFEMEVLDSPYHEVSFQNITNSHKKIQQHGDHVET